MLTTMPSFSRATAPVVSSVTDRARIAMHGLDNDWRNFISSDLPKSFIDTNQTNQEAGS